MPRRPLSPWKRSYRRRIGYEGEYYLMKKLTGLKKPGYYAVRTPGSGTGKVIKPDILAVDNGTLYALEVKSTNRNEVHIPAEQVKRLVLFSELFQISCPACGHRIKPRPVVAVRFLRRGWVFKELDDSESAVYIKAEEKT